MSEINIKDLADQMSVDQAMELLARCYCLESKFILESMIKENNDPDEPLELDVEILAEQASGFYQEDDVEDMIWNVAPDYC